MEDSIYNQIRELAKHKIKLYILHKYNSPANLMYTMSANFILKTIDFTIEAMKEIERRNK